MAWAYREKCLNEKPEVCKECGSESNVEVHHIDGDKSNDAIENLMPLCKGCHRDVHNGKIEHLYERLKPEHRPSLTKANSRIPVTESTWRELNRLKDAGETYDELIGELIEERLKEDQEQ